MSTIHIHAAGRAFGATCLLLILIVVVSGCTVGTEVACPGKPRNIVILASTSVSDIDTSRDVAGKVGKNAARIAARSCGTLSAALLTDSPQADLELGATELTAPYERVANRESVTRDLTEQAESHVADYLTAPLARAAPTRGSPFLGGLVKVGDELATQDRLPATIVVIGDLIDVEPAADGSGEVDLRTGEVDERALHSFDAGLKPLKGSCVVVVAAGAESHLPEGTIAKAQEAIGRAVRRGGASFKATRSIDIPPCG